MDMMALKVAVPFAFACQDLGIRDGAYCLKTGSTLHKIEHDGNEQIAFPFLKEHNHGFIYATYTGIDLGVVEDAIHRIITKCNVLGFDFAALRNRIKEVGE
jgi:hypothetical protein